MPRHRLRGVGVDYAGSHQVHWFESAIALQARPYGYASGSGPNRQAGMGRLRRLFISLEEGNGPRLQLVSRLRAMPSSADADMESAKADAYSYAGTVKHLHPVNPGKNTLAPK